MRLLALLALLPALARAGDWGSVDGALLGTAVGLTVLDWAQTRQIAARPERWYERNPLLGRHPSAGRVNRYFAGCVLGEVALARLLPAPWRRAALGSVVLLEAGVVAHNRRLGIGFTF